MQTTATISIDPAFIESIVNASLQKFVEKLANAIPEFRYEFETLIYQNKKETANVKVSGLDCVAEYEATFHFPDSNNLRVPDIQELRNVPAFIKGYESEEYPTESDKPLLTTADARRLAGIKKRSRSRRKG